MKPFTGIMTALVTPFKNYEVDYGSLKKLIHTQLEQGIDGFVVHGTTGESPTVTEYERKKIFQFIKSEVSKQVPLIVGTGSNSTMDSIDKSKQAEEWGADALLVVVPYYNKPPQRGLFKHFKMIAEKVSIPTILYNVPGRTVAKLEAETISELSKIKNIIGIKEATGDMAFGERILKNCREGFLLLSGDDGTCMDLMARGGHGVISVVSHLITEPMKKLSLQISKHPQDVLKEFQKYQNLIDSIYLEANPIPVKYALKVLNILESEELRPPLDALHPEFRPKITAALKELKLI